MFLSSLASSPVAVLKSELSKEIFLLSPGNMLLGFFGFEPNTMRDVLIDLVSFCPEKTPLITSDSAGPRHDQHSLYNRLGSPSVPGAACRFEEVTVSRTSSFDGGVSILRLSSAVNTGTTSAIRVCCACHSS